MPGREIWPFNVQLFDKTRTLTSSVFPGRSLRQESLQCVHLRGSAGILTWRTTHRPPEGFAERTLGFVTKHDRNPGDGFIRVFRSVPCQQHAPACQIFHWRGSDRLLEPQGEGRSRHASAFRKRLQRPTIGRLFVHCVHCRAKLFVRNGEQPSDTLLNMCLQMQAQCPNQQGVSKMLAQASSTRTKETLGWDPKQVRLIADLRDA